MYIYIHIYIYITVFFKNYIGNEAGKLAPGLFFPKKLYVK